MAKIQIPISIDEQYLRNIIKKNGYKISDESTFNKYINSKKFAKQIANDLRFVWELANDDDPNQFIEGVFDIGKHLEVVDED